MIVFISMCVHIFYSKTWEKFQTCNIEKWKVIDCNRDQFAIKEVFYLFSF